MSQDCPICAKHRGEGPLVGAVVYADDAFVVSLRAEGPLGYAFIEPRRHVATLDQLNDGEARTYGLLTVRLARALRSELDLPFPEPDDISFPEPVEGPRSSSFHVHTMVAGLGVPHLHQHVFVRHRGTPGEQPWNEPWADAPTGDQQDLAVRLGGHFGTDLDQ